MNFQHIFMQLLSTWQWWITITSTLSHSLFLFRFFFAESFNLVKKQKWYLRRGLLFFNIQWGNNVLIRITNIWPHIPEPSTNTFHYKLFNLTTVSVVSNTQSGSFTQYLGVLFRTSVFYSCAKYCSCKCVTLCTGQKCEFLWTPNTYGVRSVISEKHS